MRRRLVIFRDRHPLAGPIFWILSVQYFVIQYIVAQAWQTTYSLRSNVISDLGNTACGPYAGRYVCSPQATAMNASFVVLGLTMILGSLFIRNDFRQKRPARFGFWGMGLAGLGTMLVGLFPENTVAVLHFTGALLPFLLGNAALVLFSYTLSLPPGFKWYTRLSGGVALVALILFQSHQYLGLGQGGMERVVAYPQTIWLIVFGLYMSMDHYKRRNGSYAS